MNNQTRLVFIFFLGLCYFAFFLRLTSYPLLMWDESLFSVNAFEMIHNKNYLITYFNDTPDLWNTKPPLFTWILVLSMKIFGYNELAIRLPSAIAATITAIAVFLFVYRKLKSAAAAFFSGMVLITSLGYIGMHVARTGDADALNVLFMTLSAFSFYDFIMNSGEHAASDKKIYLSSLFFALALMTKTTYALFFIPGYLLLILLLKKQRQFRNPHLYIAFLLSMVPLLTYYIVREQYNPGYLHAVWQNDLGGRFFNTLENHSQPYWFYFFRLLNERFFPWMYILLVSLPLLFKKSGTEESSLLKMCAVVGFVFLFTLSFSGTKLNWYDAAVYPLFSIVTGIGISNFFNYLGQRIKLKKKFHLQALQIAMFSLLFLYPYRKVLSYANIKPYEASAYHVKYSYFMEHLYSTGFKEHVKFLETEFNPHLIFYTKLYQEKGLNISIIHSVDEIGDGDLVATCSPEMQKQLETRFIASVLQKDKHCICYKVSLKTPYKY